MRRPSRSADYRAVQLCTLFPIPASGVVKPARFTPSSPIPVGHSSKATSLNSAKLCPERRRRTGRTQALPPTWLHTCTQRRQTAGHQGSTRQQWRSTSKSGGAAQGSSGAAGSWGQKCPPGLQRRQWCSGGGAWRTAAAATLAASAGERFVDEPATTRAAVHAAIHTAAGAAAAAAAAAARAAAHGRRSALRLLG